MWVGKSSLEKVRPVIDILATSETARHDPDV